jgi:hypothetical protein
MIKRAIEDIDHTHNQIINRRKKATNRTTTSTTINDGNPGSRIGDSATIPSEKK